MLEQVVEYVLNNPVRSGLVERWCDHRFSAGGGQAPALPRTGVAQTWTWYRSAGFLERPLDTSFEDQLLAQTGA